MVSMNSAREYFKGKGYKVDTLKDLDALKIALGKKWGPPKPIIVKKDGSIKK